MENEKIMQVYNKGFYDELDQNPHVEYEDQLEMVAYNVGRMDALVGDDLSDFDNRPEEEIIEYIMGLYQD
jgi:hypothetical protein